MAYKLVLLFIALIQFASATDEVPGKLLSTRSISPFEAAAEVPTCDGVGVYSTCSDCNTVQICLGSATQFKKCDTPPSSTPFCVNGKCAATYNTASGCFPPGKNCTGVGFFPDASNCHIYHYCEPDGKVSSVYECPPNYVYNAESTLCKQRRFGSKDCVAVRCDQSKIFASYGSSKNYFALCKFEENVVKDIQMLKCPEHCVFDGVSCVFRCPGTGHFAHTDATQYYQCYLNGRRLVYATQSCPDGKKFDPQLRVCVTAKSMAKPEEKPMEKPVEKTVEKPKEMPAVALLDKKMVKNTTKS